MATRFQDAAPIRSEPKPALSLAKAANRPVSVVLETSSIARASMSRYPGLDFSALVQHPFSLIGYVHRGFSLSLIAARLACWPLGGLTVNQIISKTLERCLNLLTVVFLVFIAYTATTYFGASATYANAPVQERKLEHISLAPILPGVRWASADHTAVLVLRSDCHYCQQSVPFHRQLVNWSNAHPGKLQIIAVFAEPMMQARGALKLEKLDIPKVEIASMTSAKVYGTPALLVADRHGILESKYDGALSPEKQRDAIASLGIPRGAIQSNQDSSSPEKTSPSPSSIAEGLASSLVNAKETALAATAGSGVTFLDIRSRKDFAKSHIAGAVNIPRDELEARLTHEVDPTKPLLIYCTYYSKCEDDYRNKGVLTGCSVALFSVKSAGYDGARLITEDLEKLEGAGLPIWNGAASVAGIQ